MEFNRNHHFLVGLIILFLGIQFRMVESVTLNAKASAFLAKHLRRTSTGPVANAPPSVLGAAAPASHRTITPPRWLGWCLLSVGAVLVLHSFAMPKPG